MFTFRRRALPGAPIAEIKDAPLTLRSLSQLNFAFVRFSIKDQTLFAKRLSFLITAGVPLLESLTIIRAQTRSRGKGNIYESLIHDVSNGQFLSTSLAKFRSYFGDFTINIIRVGENAGILSQNLLYLADELTKKHALQRKVRGSLIYPIFITIATLGVTGLLTVFIFPKIMPIFISLNVPLPLTTRVLLSVSVFLKNWGLLVILGIVVFIVVFSIVRTKISRLHHATDYLLLYLPIVGSIARTYNAANFCRTLGLLLRSGVRISEAMQIVADVTHNVVYKKIYTAIAVSIMRGAPISEVLEKNRSHFPDMLPHMVVIGEKTGSLSDTLGYLSDLYDAEVDEHTKNLSNSIEPILLVTMGVMVGLIAVSVITPIYEVTKTLTR